MGGEKHTEQRATAHAWGSPPRGRGKAHELRTLPRAVRITPAWAGKSRCAATGAARPWDHPRVGGEKLYEQMEQGAGRGSPPRGRGKVSFTFWIILHLGITPAWAGKSVAYCWALGAREDHPRVGGEKP